MPNKKETDAMPYAVFVQLILQYGLPLALKLADMWQKQGNITPEELEEIRLLSTKTPRKALGEVLASAGISLDDPKAVALFALLPP